MSPAVADAGRERNLLLLNLPETDYRRLAPQLEPVILPMGFVLYEAESRIRHVYFPERAVVSVFAAPDDGRSVAVATIGNEGMTGLGLFLGTEQTSARVVIQVAQDAKRLSAPAFRRALRSSPSLRTTLLHYTQSLLEQVAQSSVCTQLHSLDHRCARWLLETRDRVDSNHFRLTQEFLAGMLGVRRPSVTMAAGSLQRAGLIHYTRGQITIIDRAGLEAASCPCYAITRRSYRRAMAPALRRAR